MIWPHHCRVEILVKSVDPGASKKGLWVMVTNYSGDPFFGPNGAPLAPRWALGVPTVIWPHHCRVEIFVKLVDPRVVKMGLWVMVTNYGGDPIFGPMGLTQRWAPGGPHHDLAPSP